MRRPECGLRVWMHCGDIDNPPPQTTNQQANHSWPAFSLLPRSISYYTCVHHPPRETRDYRNYNLLVRVGEQVGLRRVKDDLRRLVKCAIISSKNKTKQNNILVQRLYTSILLWISPVRRNNLLRALDIKVSYRVRERALGLLGS